MHATLSPTPYPSLSPPSSPHHTPIQCTLPWHYPRFPPPSPPPNSNAHPLTPSHPIPFPTHANPSSIPIPNSNVVALWEASGRSTLSMTITKQRHGCCSLCTLMNIIPVCTFSVTLFTRTSMQLQANKQTNKQTNKHILQWSYMYKQVNQFTLIPAVQAITGIYFRFSSWYSQLQEMLPSFGHWKWFCVHSKFSSYQICLFSA